MLDDQAIRGLLLRAAARDESSGEAFRRLYEASAPMLLGVALRIVRRRELAEEVLHDAFARIWDMARSFDPLAARPGHHGRGAPATSCHGAGANANPRAPLRRPGRYPNVRANFRMEQHESG